jgi:hypothetical protein
MCGFLSKANLFLLRGAVVVASIATVRVTFVVFVLGYIARYGADGMVNKKLEGILVGMWEYCKDLGGNIGVEILRNIFFIGWSDRYDFGKIEHSGGIEEVASLA